MNIEEIVSTHGIGRGASNGSVTDAKLAADVKVGSLAALATAIKTNVVAAINEVRGNIGTLTALTTTAKTNAVVAINEVNANADTALTNAGTAITNAATATSLATEYRAYRTLPDANGLYKTVEYKRQDGTLFKKSVLTNPDANLNYGTQTIQYFAANGTSVTSTEVWTITYDANGFVLSEVKA